MSNQLENNIRDRLTEYKAQFEATRAAHQAIDRAERESRTKYIKRRNVLRFIGDLIESIFITLGIVLSIAIVVAIIIFTSFGYTAPDGFGIQLPFCGYFWESIQ